MMPLSSVQTHRRREKMGISRRPLLICLSIVMALGFLVYFRLWIIDYRISADESELLRRQFDLAHREAVDESAEWRSRFDVEMERAAECIKELSDLKESHGKIAKDMPSADEVERLKKENLDLHERFESLKKELETVKLKCKSL